MTRSQRDIVPRSRSATYESDDDDPQMRGQVPERGHHVVGRAVTRPMGSSIMADVVQIVIGTVVDYGAESLCGASSCRC